MEIGNAKQNPKELYAISIHQSHPKKYNSPRDPVPEKPDDGVILHQPLSLSIFRKIALFWPIFERDSCIPPVGKRRTPLPGAPAVTNFRPFFGPNS